MPFNRGYRRDDRAYQSNIGQNSGQRHNVSPWECGVAPNAIGPRGGYQSILQMQTQAPQQSNQNIVTQQQQHALAVASNLLSNLGLLTQQVQQPRELPSLMSMNSLNNLSRPNSFRLPDTFGQLPNNQFNNNMNTMRRNKPNHASHRVEPYKNHARPSYTAQPAQQQGRRPPFNKLMVDRKPLLAQSRKPQPLVKSGDKAANASKSLTDLRFKLLKTGKETKNVQESKETDVVKSKLLEKKPPEETSAEKIVSVEEAKRDDEQAGNKKRDWKDEKKPDVVMSPDNVVASEDGIVDKSGDAPMEVDKLDTAKDKKDGAATEKTVKISEPASFYCHVCILTDLDEQEFKKHIKSDEHEVKMTERQEAMAVNTKKECDFLREVMQNAVIKQALEVEKKKTLGRKIYQGINRDYCKMCDLNFFGTIANHRKNELHHKLKLLLHPRCNSCSKEFANRTEFEFHRLTISHQLRDKSGGCHLDGVPSVAAEGVVSPEDNEKKAQIDSASLTYTPSETCGLHYIVSGHQCQVCQLFFTQLSDAELHCKTILHSANCKNKEMKIGTLVIKSEPTDSPNPSMEDDPEVVAIESGSEDNEGNWKRQRFAEKEDDDEVVTKPSTESGELNGDKPCDPLEPEVEEINGLQVEKEEAVEATAEEREDTILADLDKEIVDILDSAEIAEKVVVRGEPAVGEEPAVGGEPAVRGGARGRRGYRRSGYRGKRMKL